MVRLAIIASLSMALAAAGSALSAAPRDYCPDRPGIGNPTCTMDAGATSVEVGLADWSRDSMSGSERTTELLLGDLLVRRGIAGHAEVQIGWTSFGRHAERGPLGTTSQNGVGDVFLALRRNLKSPDGSGTSLAVMIKGTLPTGGFAAGSGDWSAGLEVPLSFELNDHLSFALMPSVEAAVDEDRSGRHLAYANVVGLTDKLSDQLGATIEYQLERDRDPSGHQMFHVAGLSMGLQPNDDLQFDFGVNAGLNHAATDVELYAGISRRF
ncbi:MAG: transporter [Rhizorhabdus sp.]|uniref:transporter n=1 Tax=Rhizorhabdus sp. TaxID=1968843 RepID=UPI001B5902E0|nr:transporter [Rhizorhabdus sp.]MBP8234948.1 transporter [Rhizorhabdus sp.]